MAFSVVLEGGSPWGFRLQGGVDFNEPVKIAKINPNSKASAKGVQVGDYLDKINNTNTEGLSHHEVQQLMKNAGNTLALELCKPDARISRSDTRLNSLPLPARSAAPTSNTQLHATMNGDVRGVPHNRDVRGHADPYIMNNNEGENTIKPYKPTSLSGPPESFHNSDVSQHYSSTTGKSTDIYTNSEPKPGIWSPGQSSQPLLNHDINNTDEQNVTGTDKTDIVPVWSPTGETNTVRKEFRPVRLDTNVRKVADKTHKPGEYTAKETFAWKPSPSPSMETSPSTSTITTTTTTSTIGSPTVTTSTTSTAHWNGNISNMEDSKSGLPKPQSPTITLLQKGREGQLPKGAVYVGTKEVVDGDVKHIDTYYMAPSEEKVTTVTKIEKKAPKYEGIGPQTGEGMPMGLKTTIDEEHQKDWYKKMYKSIHKTERPKDQNTYTPTYVFPSDSESEKEEPPNPYVPSYEYPSKFTHKDDRPWTNLDKMDPSVNDKKFTHEGYGKGPMSYAHARSRLEIYKNQPRSITEYEPGFSSIAFKEAKTDDTSDDKGILYNPPIEKPGQFSRYTIKDHSGSEPDIRKTNRDPRSISPTDSHEAYKIIQKGGEIPLSGLRLPAPDKVEKSSPKDKTRHRKDEGEHRHSTSDIPRSPISSLERKRREEEDEKRRKEQMRKFYEEERKKKLVEEAQKNRARRHSDNFMPKEKSPIPTDRFEEGMPVPIQPGTLARKKIGRTIRGKARALYTFNAQNPKELAFKKGDVIYLTRDIDSNWMEGEHHGRAGIFPKNYVEVLQSVEQAQQLALSSEGEALARFNFTAQTSVELSIKKGDIITLIRRVDDNWLEGRLNDRQGIFPTSYVEIIREPDTPMSTPMTSLAPTPRTGSPAPLSPVSVSSISTSHSFISNGPSAAMSDRSWDSRSYDQRGQRSQDPYRQQTDRFHRSDRSDGYMSDTYTRPERRRDDGYMSDTYTRSMDRRRADDSRTNSLPRKGDGRIRDDGYMSDTHDLSNVKITGDWYMESLMRNAKPPPPQQQQQQAQKHDSYSNRTSGAQQNGYHSLDRSPSKSPSMSKKPSPQYGGDQRGYGKTQGVRGPSPIFMPPKEPEYPMFKAVYTYVPQNADELELREGDIVYVMEKCDDGWYVGTSQRTQQFGTFPGNYVNPV